MLAQMKRQAVTRDLHVNRKVRLETMLPIHLEAEKIEIELASLVDRENAEDGHNAAELDCHRSSLRLVAVAKSSPRADPATFVAPSGVPRYRPPRRSNDA